MRVPTGRTVALDSYCSADALAQLHYTLGGHVASYGKVRQTFEKVAVRVNQNPHMSQKVSWKSVQDRYKRLQDDFDQEDARNGALSGVAGG